MAACNTCDKSPPEVNLKLCAKCSTTQYCSRDCQKADWKAHKKICSVQADAVASNVPPNPPPVVSPNLSPLRGLDKPIDNPFMHLDRGTWLHYRSDRDVYRLLIDAYRLNIEDDYEIHGIIYAKSLYGGASSGLNGFRHFLELAASRPGLLPSWWSKTKKKTCERLGMNNSQWHDLRCAVEKSDIVEHYGDRLFPMQLRMFAKAVYCQGTAELYGADMKKMMAKMEVANLQGAYLPLPMIDVLFDF
ncbi:hypothetical protein TOPH_02756 [Tolypocladium ophioglossoides CBS 100239]|uniref:MYND-type domain-containing protein n=1 Tax=Tolypocladium ophioglossoides (strain CBS 100239) TaxID=1163406 RepID=A0A0L0NE95_TOLOC|nr:hypothetical protein TOPH_02756 [Tolypocladium ophioglossoides CBS 100239]